MLRILITNILILSFIIGCGANSPQPKIKLNGEPNSHQATFVESSSSSLTMVRATGKNATLASAKDDSARAALWFVLQSGNNKLLQTKAEKNKFKSL